MSALGCRNFGCLSGKGGDVCEEPRKRMVDTCTVYSRWRGQGARMLRMKGRRYKLWWSGKVDGVGGVGVMVKEELCERVVRVRRVSDRVMTVVCYEEDVLRLIWEYATQSGRCLEENSHLMMSCKVSGMCIVQVT